MFPTETLVIWYFTSLSGIHSWGELFDLFKVPFGKDPSLVSTLWSTSLGTFRFLCLLSQTFCCLPWMHWTYGVLGPRSFSLLMTWKANVCTQFAMAWSFKKKKFHQSIKSICYQRKHPASSAIQIMAKWFLKKFTQERIGFGDDSYDIMIPVAWWAFQTVFPAVSLQAMRTPKSHSQVVYPD